MGSLSLGSVAFKIKIKIKIKIKMGSLSLGSVAFEHPKTNFRRKLGHGAASWTGHTSVQNLSHARTEAGEQP